MRWRCGALESGAEVLAELEELVDLRLDTLRNADDGLLRAGAP